MLHLNTRNTEAPTAATGQQIMLVEDGEPSLCLHHVGARGPAVLYVHGSTFPAALSIDYRIDGRSWADDLRSRGFDLWSFDFAGYGCSERIAGAPRSGSDGIPGKAGDAVHQIKRVVSSITDRTGQPNLSIIAHSWGSIPAGLFASMNPEWVNKLILFGPVAERHERADRPVAKAMFVTAEDQWKSFQGGLPPGRQSLIEKAIFDLWAKAYLSTDCANSSRTPASVEVPGGPAADIKAAWSGHLPYDPSLILAPTLIVRGEWDPITRDADAAWLVAALKNVPGGAQDVKLAEGAHRMHLERNRQSLFDAVGDFLARGRK